MPGVRQLLPEPAEIDPFEAHAGADRPPPPGRPWMALNMVASADGATSVDGVSESLGGPADFEVFKAIRAVADVIVAAAGTVRAEGYGPPKPSKAVQAARLARGQTRVPRLAVVSRTLELDEHSAMFTEADEPPLVFTTDDPPADRVAALEPVADLRAAGPGSVDFSAMAAILGELGVRCAVVEGGPALNGQLLAADLVDELNLTIAAVLAGGPSKRVVVSDVEAVHPLALAHLWESDGHLLARYVRG